MATQAHDIQTVEAKEPPPPSVVDEHAERPTGVHQRQRPLHAHLAHGHAARHRRLLPGRAPGRPPATCAAAARRSAPRRRTSTWSTPAISRTEPTSAARASASTARCSATGTTACCFDFGGSGVENTGQLYETWVQYSGFKPFRLRVGAFSPVDRDGGPGFDQRHAVHGALGRRGPGARPRRRRHAARRRRSTAGATHWLVSGAVTGRTIGVLNTGTATAVPQTFGDQLGFVGRARVPPFHGDDWLVQVGVHGSYVDRPANTAGPAANGITPITGARGRVQQHPAAARRRDQADQHRQHRRQQRRHRSGWSSRAQKRTSSCRREYEDFGVRRTDIASDPNFQRLLRRGPVDHHRRAAQLQPPDRRFRRADPGRTRSAGTTEPGAPGSWACATPIST